MHFPSKGYHVKEGLGANFKLESHRLSLENELPQKNFKFRHFACPQYRKTFQL